MLGWADSEHVAVSQCPAQSLYSSELGVQSTSLVLSLPELNLEQLKAICVWNVAGGLPLELSNVANLNTKGANFRRLCHVVLPALLSPRGYSPDRDEHEMHSFLESLQQREIVYCTDDLAGLRSDLGIALHVCVGLG